MSSAATEIPECPLCMEVFELDDINFFPCICGYQICRFCWHRIRTDENGLCPACRKAYPENPAQFKPLTEDELQRIKKDWKQKESQKKQKSADSRKHLTNVRVVQKNLVFVVGLTQRLTDPDTLKRPEYFGKFGKIHKVVINQSTSYVGSQGPNSSAYVTYYRPEDALAAIRVVNNLQIEGRTLKASLGTTKYCSHFLKGTQCMKTDCMYLHDVGDDIASFTKEEIQQGKHLQYEQKLHEQYSSSSSHSMPTGSGAEASSNTSYKALESTAVMNGYEEFEGSSSSSSGDSSPVSHESSSPPNHQSINQSNHLLNNGEPIQRLQDNSDARLSLNNTDSTHHPTTNDSIAASATNGHIDSVATTSSGLSASTSSTLHNGSSVFCNGLSLDNLSLFSDNGFTSNRQCKVEPSNLTAAEEALTSCREPEIAESMPVKSNTNWQEAFGFSSDNDNQDDDLGFDPWDVSARGLADMIESEKISSQSRLPFTPHLPPLNGFSLPHNSSHTQMPLSRMLPPGFTPNGFHSSTHLPPHYLPSSLGRSKMLNIIQQSHQMQQQQQQLQQQQHQNSVLHNHNPGIPYSYPTNGITNDHMYGQHESGKPDSALFNRQPPYSMNGTDEVNIHKWQEGFRALLPNINISFGAPSDQLQQQRQLNGHAVNGLVQSPTASRIFPSLDTALASQSMPDLTFDPMMMNAGLLADGSSYGEEPPHWMASLHHLTDDQHTSLPSHLPPWMSAAPHTARYPPPGFSMPRQNSEPQALSAAADQKL